MNIKEIKNIIPGSPPFCDVTIIENDREITINHVRMVISCNGWVPCISDILDELIK